MKMYVANCSAKRYEFTWRVHEQPKPRTLIIQPMSQVMLVDDLTADDRDAIISQHEPYGFVAVEDAKNGRVPKKRTELIYSMDAPVSALMISYLYDFNRGILTKLGEEMRKEAAIVANNAVARALQEQREMQGLDANVSDVEMSVMEEETTRSDINHEPVSESITVDSGRPRRRSGR